VIMVIGHSGNGDGTAEHLLVEPGGIPRPPIEALPDGLGW